MSKTVKVYFSLFFLFVVFGMVTVFNIKVFSVNAPDQYVWRLLRSQLLNFVVASLGFTAAYMINIEALRNWIKYLLIITILLLLSTYLIGTEINGSTRWINLGFFMLQPSEFAKIVVIFYLAEVICNKRERIGLLKELVYPFSMVAFVVLIIAFEDLGTGVIIFGVALMLLIMGGMKVKYLSVLVLLASITITILILMKPYRVQRIRAFFDPWKYKQSIGYQQVQSEIALGRGGVTGVGFGNSQRKMKYLPEASTDFIFSIVGEEYGFAGTTVLIILFGAFFLMGIYFALTRNNAFYFYLISGFVLLLAVQSVINMGVVTSLLPNKGVPLPFISYGGSALLAYSLMIGFIMNAVVADNKYFLY